MDYNDLALFVRIVENESFTAAARAAGVQKSSVTRCVSRLEEALGVRLIQRTTHQRGVTDAGRVLYDRIRTLFSRVDDATNAIRDIGGEPSGVVRLTLPPGFSLGGTPSAIAAFVRLYPRIRVDLLLAARAVDLVREGVDIAVRMGELEDSSLVGRRIGCIHSGLFATPSYLETHGRPLRPSDLVNHDCIAFRGSNGTATWQLVGRDGAGTVSVAGPICADERSWVINTIKAGAGIGDIPLPFARRDVEAGHLTRILPNYHVAGLPVNILLPSSSFVPSRVALLRDFLIEHIVRDLGATPDGRRT